LEQGRVKPRKLEIRRWTSLTIAIISSYFIFINKMEMENVNTT
jgi:hypothetical protein